MGPIRNKIIKYFIRQMCIPLDNSAYFGGGGSINSNRIFHLVQLCYHCTQPQPWTTPTFSFQSKDSDNESDDDYVPYIPLKQRRKMEQSKMAKLGRARQLAKMEEKKASSSEAGSGDDTGPEVGPNANVSLLDQHSRLKVEAEGKIQGPIAVWNRCFIIPGPLRAVQFQYMYFVHRKLRGH